MPEPVNTTNSSHIYVIRKNGDVEFLKEIPNLLGTSFVIWKALSEKYGHTFSVRDKTTGGVEKLATSEVTPLYEKICLVFTYEGVWVKKTNMPALINALEDFSSINLVKELRGTLHDLTEVLRQIFLSPELIGVAFNQVGNVKSFWHVYETLPDSEQEDLHIRNYNIFKDKGHFELFAELNAAEEPEPGLIGLHDGK
jgi:hypothetical protein